MKKNFVKKLALGLAMVMAVTSVNVPASAAAKPAFKTASVEVEEGETVKAVIKKTKGYTIKKVVSKNTEVATIKKVAQKAKKTNVKITGVKAGEAVVKAVLKKGDNKVKTTLAVTVKSVKTEVTAATATASRTITLTGTNLDKLTAADVTVTGYTVTGINATKTSASVTLDRMMVPNTEIPVTVGEFSSKVTYSLTVNSLAVIADTFDDDLAGQTVKFTVNGEQIEAQDLLNNGYTVDFSAYQVIGGVNTVDTTLFPLASNKTLGVIAVPATEGVYYVSVTVSNGTTVVTSEYAKIIIDDLHASINSIDSYELLNGAGFVQNSTTMVMGETATFQNVKATVDGMKGQDIVPTTITSSNPSVVSVAGGVLTAETVGTSVITLTYGNVTKTVNITVTTTGRVLSSAKAVKFGTTTGAAITSATVVSDSSTTKTETLTIIPLDQYGDPVVNGQVFAASSNETVAVVTNPANWQTAAPVANGVATISVQVQTGAKGYTSIIIRDKAITSITNQTNTKTLLTFAYNVIDNDTVAYKKLVLAPQSAVESTDAALEVSADATTTLVLAGYNSANVKVKDLSLAGYDQPTSTDNTVVTATHDGSKITVTGLKAGTATVTLRETASGKTVSMVFTVSQTVPTITGVTFKQAATITTMNTTVDYGKFLTLTAVGTGKDPIVSGITTNVNTTSKLRINEASGQLYLDRNDDGTYTTGVSGRPDDIILGYVVISSTTNSSFVATNGYLTQPGDAGFVKVVVYADAANTIVKAATTIAVNVPNVQ